MPAGQVINPDVLDDDDFSFDEPVKFRSLTRLSTTDMADALQVARARILRYLEKRGVITLDSDADSDVLCVSEELAEPVPAARFQANC